MDDRLQIRAARAADHAAIERVCRTAFEGEAEAELVESLRQGGFVAVELVAVATEQVVGQIMLTHVEIHTDAEPVPALSLAPMSVLPERQRQGIGAALVEAALQKAALEGHRVVLVLGHPNYYPRWGFRADLAAPIRSPFGGGAAWMARELEPGALAGVQGEARFSPPFTAFM